MLLNLRNPTSFPDREMSAFEIFLIVLLGIANFLTVLHAWLHLDRCERKRGKDTRKNASALTKKASRQSTQGSHPARHSLSTAGTVEAAGTVETGSGPQHAETVAVDMPAIGVSKEAETSCSDKPA
jgi:hypothetical protein